MKLLLAQPDSRAPCPYEGFSLFLVGGAAVFIPLSYLFGIHIPSSPIRAIFGIPCPLCGGTRAVTSLGLGRFWEALAYNPLALVILALMLLAIARWILMVLPFRRRIEAAWTRAERRTLPVIVVVTFIANWVYVLWSGRYAVELTI